MSCESCENLRQQLADSQEHAQAEQDRADSHWRKVEIYQDTVRELEKQVAETHRLWQESCSDAFEKSKQLVEAKTSRKEQGKDYARDTEEYLNEIAAKEEVEKLKTEIIELEMPRCEACIKAERSQLQCIICKGPFTFYDEPCHKCFADLQSQLASLREVARAAESFMHSVGRLSRFETVTNLGNALRAHEFKWGKP